MTDGEEQNETREEERKEDAAVGRSKNKREASKECRTGRKQNEERKSRKS